MRKLVAILLLLMLTPVSAEAGKKSRPVRESWVLKVQAPLPHQPTYRVVPCTRIVLVWTPCGYQYVLVTSYTLERIYY